MTTLIEKNITAANTFSESFRFDGDFNFSVRGTLTAGTTVTVQRSIDDATWADVDTFTSISENVGYEPELLFYRAGCKTAEFAGGDNITIRFGAKWMTLT
tara:strand:- start:340 stop:639 length:300 start_codon:yes stop_codon:yes gene_type:complete